jgi:hypothetical protein
MIVSSLSKNRSVCISKGNTKGNPKGNTFLKKDRFIANIFGRLTAEKTT